MSFQAHVDAIEKTTGRTPLKLLDDAHARCSGLTARAGEDVTWFADDHGVGRGHAIAFVHVLTNGAGTSDAHVGGSGSHRDESDVLDGLAHR